MRATVIYVLALTEVGNPLCLWKWYRQFATKIPELIYWVLCINCIYSAQIKQTSSNTYK